MPRPMSEVTYSLLWFVDAQFYSGLSKSDEWYRDS